MESTYYTPTQADLDDFALWCWMRDYDEQEQQLAQIWAEREQEAFL